MFRVLIPAKAFTRAKQRLSPVLDAAERAALAAAMLTRTIAVAKEAFGDASLRVVTPDAEVGRVALLAGADAVVQVADSDLNAELEEAARQAPDRQDLLVLHADLPLLCPQDLVALAAHRAPVVIAVNRHGDGTNALLLRDGARFFAFGPESCARHRQAAAARGLEAVVVRSPGLSHDLDEPDDWRLLSAHLDNFR